MQLQRDIGYLKSEVAVRAGIFDIHFQSGAPCGLKKFLNLSLMQWDLRLSPLWLVCLVWGEGAVFFPASSRLNTDAVALREQLPRTAGKRILSRAIVDVIKCESP
jgi:hypothetical protein